MISHAETLITVFTRINAAALNFSRLKCGACSRVELIWGWRLFESWTRQRIVLATTLLFSVLTGGALINFFLTDAVLNGEGMGSTFLWCIVLCCTVRVIMRVRLTIHLGPVPRKMVKFNPGLSQISSMVFSSKNLQLEVTIYCSIFTTRYSNNNTKCYPKQCIGMQNRKTEQNFNPGLTLIDTSGTGPRKLPWAVRFAYTLYYDIKSRSNF